HTASNFSVFNERAPTSRCSHSPTAPREKSAIHSMFTKQPSRPILKGVRPRRVPLVLPSVLWLLWSAIQLTPTSAKAERTHTVQVGQSLAYIAKLYGVTTWSLAAANALSPESTVRAGQVL